MVTGEKIGPYTIVGKLGEGGMGAVFRAHDTKLDRDVAIKVLPEAFAVDPDRLARFEREARTLASLNHPHIAAIYAVEKSGPSTGSGQAGTLALVMELVEGDDLSKRIARGALPLDEALPIARQIAEALEAAHEQGIIHRDLKPANIKVRADGTVKVLDFGLAKAVDQGSGVGDQGSGRAANSPTITTPAMPLDWRSGHPEQGRGVTQAGVILGTAAYMSPEQARGKPVDRRTDVWAFGCVLYEMLTGRPTFAGDTVSDIISGILRAEPDWTQVPAETPEPVRRLLALCLAKDARERLPHVGFARIELANGRPASSSVASAPSAIAPERTALTTQNRSARLAWIVAGVAVLAALAVAGVAWRGSSEEVAPTAPRMTFSRLTLLDGVAREPMISPDGKWVVYVSNASGNPDIYLQSTTGETAINLTKDSPAADTAPAFSPDGERIAFRSERDGGGLFVMGRTGESVRRVTRRGIQSGIQPAWFPDGRRLAFGSVPGITNTVEARGGGISELWMVDTTGGEPQRIYRGDAVQPRVSPNGRRIAFWAMQPNEDFTGFASPNRDVWTVAVDGTDPVRVTTEEAIDWNPVWSPDGTALYFLSNRSGSMNLWRVGIDETTGATTGEAQALTAPTSYVRHFSLSADGRLGTYANWATMNNLARVRIDARAAATRGPIEAITSGSRDFLTFDVKDDGQAVLMTNVTQQEDLLIAATGSGLRHLVNDRYRDRNPRWTADGRQVFFYSDRGQDYELYSIDGDGGGLRQLTDTGGKRFYPVPSHDGSKVLAADITSYELFEYDASDFSKAPNRLPPLPPDLRGGSFIPLEWSPDGRSVSGLSGPAIWVYSFETRAYRRAGTSAAHTAQWFPDGRRLLVNRQGRVFALDVETGAEREVLAIEGELIGTARLSADGTWLYFLHGSASGDIWTVRFDNDAAAGK